MLTTALYQWPPNDWLGATKRKLMPFRQLPSDAAVEQEGRVP